MNHIQIHLIQADIIYKALHYVAKHEGVSIPEELEKTYEVLAEQNPNETVSSDTLDVMESLNSFIRNNEPYKQYFEEEEED